MRSCRCRSAVRDGLCLLGVCWRPELGGGYQSLDEPGGDLPDPLVVVLGVAAEQAEGLRGRDPELGVQMPFACSITALNSSPACRLSTIRRRPGMGPAVTGQARQHPGASDATCYVLIPGARASRQADIIELILADHRRIGRPCRALYDTARYDGSPRPDWMPGHVWQRLADLLVAHT